MVIIPELSQRRNAAWMACLTGLLLVALYSLSCAPRSNSGSVSGTVETDEARLASRYGGRVAQVLAEEGQELKGQQVIVILDAAELKARRDLAAAMLAEMEAGPRKQELEAARAEWEALIAELELARTDQKRAEELFAQKAISTLERDQAVTRARNLEKTAGASRARYDLLVAGTRPEKIEQARAQLAEIDTQIREMIIEAPTNCVLEVLHVKPGDVLAPGGPVATILFPQHLWVRVYVPEPWLGNLKIGQRVTVQTDSDRGRSFEGVIEQIAREAEFTPRNVQTRGERVKQVFGIKVRLDSTQGKLRAGMSVDVVFPGHE